MCVRGGRTARLRNVSLVEMAKFLLKNGVNSEELAARFGAKEDDLAPGVRGRRHVQMARLAEERRIDLERLLCEHGSAMSKL